jgi:hypothetical protein
VLPAVHIVIFCTSQVKIDALADKKELKLSSDCLIPMVRGYPKSTIGVGKTK